MPYFLLKGPLPVARLCCVRVQVREWVIQTTQPNPSGGRTSRLGDGSFSASTISPSKAHFPLAPRQSPSVRRGESTARRAADAAEAAVRSSLCLPDVLGGVGRPLETLAD
jgi:hypothetical protein